MFLKTIAITSFSSIALAAFSITTLPVKAQTSGELLGLPTPQEDCAYQMTNLVSSSQRMYNEIHSYQALYERDWETTQGFRALKSYENGHFGQSIDSQLSWINRYCHIPGNQSMAGKISRVNQLYARLSDYATDVLNTYFE